MTSTLKSILLVLGVMLASSASAQPRGTAVYAEGFGPSGSYAVGVEQSLVERETSRIAARLGASLYREPSTPGLDDTGRIAAFPAALAVLVSLGDVASVPVSFELEGGATFARWWGPVDRFHPVPGQTFRIFPHGAMSLRGDLADGRLFVRGGVTLGGVQDEGTDVTPLLGVGVGL